jgi:hypothetical protein
MTSRATDKNCCRFSIAKHEMPANSSRHSHFDLFLESQGTLLTWELSSLPTTPKKQLVRRLANHRLVYLDFQGPLSDDRGTVKLVDSGSLKWMTLESERLIAHIKGQTADGILTLTSGASSTDDVWNLTFEPVVLTPQSSRD